MGGGGNKQNNRGPKGRNDIRGTDREGTEKTSLMVPEKTEEKPVEPGESSREALESGERHRRTRWMGA